VEQKKNVVAADVAAEEFNRWAEALDLDIAPEGMNEDDRRGFNEQKRLVIRAIEAGRLTINTEGLAVFKPRDKHEGAITFFEPNGAVVIKGRAQSDAERVAGMVHKMTGEPMSRFEDMPVRDYKVCTAIVTLLLAAR
jgi:hypothetical protein